MSIKKLSLLALPLVATLSLQAANPFNDPFFNDPFGDDIFKEMRQMQKDMDKMFDRMQERRQQRSSGLVSPLGTYRMSAKNQFVDKGDLYELLTNIPESKESHIDINTADHVMSITAKVIHKQEHKTGAMISRSSSVRIYQQSIVLPHDAEVESMKTAYKNGKLTITVRKKKTEVKRIEPKKPELKQIETKKDKVKESVPVQSNRVEITDEFNQTPETVKKDENKSSAKESKKYNKENNLY